MTHVRALQGGPFSCLRCGAEYVPAYPCPIGAWNALAAWFTATHEECLPLGNITSVAQNIPDPAENITLKAPFPWFGGKSRVADVVWQRFGEVRNYIEPFFGSGAVLLGRPRPFRGYETVNDVDGYVANFWRALQAAPDDVAMWADAPVNENDLHARHVWLLERKGELQRHLEGDPHFYHPKIAGWWVWGIAVWIGGGFCSGRGPWRSVDVDGRRQLVRSPHGNGVERKRPSLTHGRGVERTRPHLSENRGLRRKLPMLEGRGLQRRRVHLKPQGIKGHAMSTDIVGYMRALAERLADVRVCCGDWSRVVTSVPLTTGRAGPVGIFLDPPYADTATRDPDLYTADSLEVAHDVRRWALEHGDDPRLRIALCGYEGEHEMPPSWECYAWQAHGGYANIRGNGRGLANRCRERIWFSPHCQNERSTS